MVSKKSDIGKFHPAAINWAQHQLLLQNSYYSLHPPKSICSCW
jgi:hypothetical protein